MKRLIKFWSTEKNTLLFGKVIKQTVLLNAKFVCSSIDAETGICQQLFRTNQQGTEKGRTRCSLILKPSS
jgi:hypothetical protein